jgi:hypothetical protein
MVLVVLNQICVKVSVSPPVRVMIRWHQSFIFLYFLFMSYKCYTNVIKMIYVLINNEALYGFMIEGLGFFFSTSRPPMSAS